MAFMTTREDPIIQDLEALQTRLAPVVTLAELLRFTKQLREEGGAEIKLPNREPRPSPFSGGRQR
jgi:hypothetical protein